MSLLKTLIISALLCSSMCSYAQCKFDKDKKDDFTGEKYRMVEQRISTLTTYWWMTLEQKGTTYYLGLKNITNNHIGKSVRKGEKFYFKLENGKVLTLEADQDYAPSVYSANGGTQTTIIVKGIADEPTMKELSGSSIASVRLVVGGIEKTHNQIPSRQTEKVKEYASCLVNGK